MQVAIVVTEEHSQNYRYLLAQKPSPEEKQHKVRTMWGNGLRAELWPEFVDRFDITKVGEFFGSTEGNSNIGRRYFYLSVIKPFQLMLTTMWVPVASSQPMNLSRKSTPYGWLKSMKPLKKSSEIL